MRKPSGDDRNGPLHAGNEEVMPKGTQTNMVFRIWDNPKPLNPKGILVSWALWEQEVDFADRHTVHMQAADRVEESGLLSRNLV